MNVYAFITPLVIVLLLLEIAYSTVARKGVYDFQDTITNLGTGIGNQCINLAVAFFVYTWYGWLYQFAPWQIPTTWYSMLGLLIISDFVFYWFHRTGHRVNIFWAAHMPHHSSEEMNLSVGLRASFTQRLFQFLFFDWILVLIGFSPEQVYAVAAVHLLLAYWHHTRLIKRMGWFERIFVAPAHHRVHHGVNPQYIDKNYSEFLIIWDKLFGSFEDEDEEVCYGITHPPRTWDPLFINFQFWRQLCSDAWNTRSWWDKLRIWFMPTGWRPADLRSHEASSVIGYTLTEQVKFRSKGFPGMSGYIVAQVLLGLGYMYVTINMQWPLSAVDRFMLSVGIFGMIVSWGGIMQARRWAIPLEVLRLLYMSGTLVIVLHRTDLLSWTSWFTVVVALVVGISILFFSYRARRSLAPSSV
ncbi:MAG TPA: sterol desaturase family protein [Flavobacteriales bacterium]|nr:sterol desaturase family protein [Flavobacteriales bacterium]HNU56726.1 sterol desaturase family protein [Flavobacteriales bacterium]